MNAASRALQRSVLAGVLALGASAGAGIFVVGKRAHAVTVDDAVQRFRSSGTPETAGAVAPPTAETAAVDPGAGPALAVVAPDAAPVAAASNATAGRARTTVTSPSAGRSTANGATTPRVAFPTPRNGVYTYATTGEERVSALGGASHTYPATTTISVTGTGCAQVARWDGLQERYEELGLCAVGEGTRVRSFTTYHSFYGQVDKKAYQCEPATMARPDSRQPGAATTGTCDAGNAKAVVTTSVVGMDTVRVGETDVPALKVHGDEVLTGATAGKRITDTWFSLTDNLVLRRTASVDADTDSAIGQTHYVERYDLRLTSTTPRT